MKIHISKRKVELALAYIKTWCSKFWRFWFTNAASQNTPYKAAFMTPYERCQTLSKYNKGVTINGVEKLDLSMSMRHILVLGSSGSGKSVNCFYPTIYSLDYPMLILDVSGVLFKQCSGALKRKGFQVYQINFAKPLSALPYNPILRCETQTQMKMIAQTLVTTAFGASKGDSAYWNNSAMQLCFFLIAFLKKHTPKRYQTLANVRQLLNHLTPEKECAAYQFIRNKVDDSLWSEFMGVMQGEKKTVNNVISTLKTALEKIADPELASFSSRDGFNDLQKLRQKRTAVFVSVPEKQIQYYGFMISLFLSDLFEMVMRPRTKRCLPYFFILDECSQVHIPNFFSIISTLRKHQASVTICSQTKSMLEHQYGQAAARSIMYAGCSTHVFMPGQVEAQTNESLSRQLGSTTIRHNGKDVVRPLLTPDEIFSMKDKCIFLQTGRHPALLKLHPFFKNKRLNRLTKIPPVKYKTRRKNYIPLINLAAYKLKSTASLIDHHGHE